MFFYVSASLPARHLDLNFVRGCVGICAPVDACLLAVRYSLFTPALIPLERMSSEIKSEERRRLACLHV